MNYVVMNEGMVLSDPMSREDAENRVQQLKDFKLYPNAYYVETEDKPKEKIVLTAPVENVEDVGCSGGACAL